MKVYWHQQYTPTTGSLKTKAYIFGVRVPVRFAMAWARFWGRYL